MNWFAEYIKKYYTKLVMLQEHFKIASNAVGLFRKELINYNINCKKAVRKLEELRGRGSGGLLQMSCNDKVLNMAPINTSSYRLQAQRLKDGLWSILWLNVYFPIDGEDMEELITLLAELEMIRKYEDTSSVIVGGDFNYNTARTSASEILTKEWRMEKMDLYSVWDKHHVNFTHYHLNFSSVSTIDYFMMSPDLLNIVKDAGVFHHAEEYSRHNPIWVKLDLGKLKTR